MIDPGTATLVVGGVSQLFKAIGGKGQKEEKPRNKFIGFSNVVPDITGIKSPGLPDNISDNVPTPFRGGL